VVTRRRTSLKPRKPRKIKLTERDKRIQQALNTPEIFDGLSPQEQLALAKEIRGVGRLSKYLETRYRQPTEDDFRQMALVCAKAIVSRQRENGERVRSDRIFVTIRLPYFFREKNKTFPLGVLMSADVLSVTMRINANKVLDWLYELGYSDFSSKELRKYLGVFERELTAWENEFTILNTYGRDEDIFLAWGELMNDIKEKDDD